MVINEREDELKEDEATDINEFMAVNVAFNHEKGQFWGGYLESGAQRTVIGKPQAEKYLDHVATDCKIMRDGGHKVFKFGHNTHKCIGTIEIRLPIGSSFYVPITANVSLIDVPLLIGIDIMKQLGMVINLSNDRLITNKYNQEVSLKTKMGHLYLEWPLSTTFYTEHELKRIHKHFHHPSSEKLYALMKRADEENINPDVKKALENIQR